MFPGPELPHTALCFTGPFALRELLRLAGSGGPPFMQNGGAGLELGQLLNTPGGGKGGLIIGGPPLLLPLTPPTMCGGALYKSLTPVRGVLCSLIMGRPPLQGCRFVHSDDGIPRHSPLVGDRNLGNGWALNCDKFFGE